MNLYYDDGIMKIRILIRTDWKEEYDSKNM